MIAEIYDQKPKTLQDFIDCKSAYMSGHERGLSWRKKSGHNPSNPYAIDSMFNSYWRSGLRRGLAEGPYGKEDHAHVEALCLGLSK